jgi:hypothetical protein
MSYGPVKKYAVTFASGATVTSEVDLGRAYSQIYLELNSATTFNYNIQAANASGGSFKRIYHPPADNDAVVTAVEITSATAGLNGAIVKLPVTAQYMKIESQTAVADGMTLNLICVD